jgi:NAD(P)-dependent dehydrogenase (short-subunit alcohol dehydrogenase family)
MNAIITGGGGDIGGACARLLATRGTKVLVVDADRTGAEHVAREINENTDSTAVAEAIAADVSVSADVIRYVAAAAAHGPIEAVVHAAGVSGPAAAMPRLR